MKNLNTSQETALIGQPFGGVSNKFMQDAYTEVLGGAFGLMLGQNNSGITIVSGLVYGFSSPTFTISAGWVYYFGNLYYVPAQSISTGGTNTTLVAVYNTTDDGLGPVVFTDGIPRVVYNDNQINLSASTTGTGISGDAGSDFLNWASPAGRRFFPSLLNSFTAFTPTTLVTVRKDFMGNVEITGRVVAPGGQTIITNLPAMFWPLETKIWSTFCDSSSTIGADLVLGTTGNLSVTLQSATAPLIGANVSTNVNFNIND